MPAALNLSQLFDFEGQFETAAQAILSRVLIDAYVSGQDEQVPVLHTRIGFDVGPARAGDITQLARPLSWPAGEPPPREYFRYSAGLEYHIQVPRDDRQPTIAGVSSMLAQIRAQLREAMMGCVRPFNEVNLPHYKVTDIRPNGTSSGQVPNTNADITILRFTLTFEIRKDVWPAWVEV